MSPANRAYRSLDQVVNDAISRSFAKYTVGAGNLERVIGLTVEDAITDLRPRVREQVRALYGTVLPPRGQAIRCIDCGVMQTHRVCADCFERPTANGDCAPGGAA